MALSLSPAARHQLKNILTAFSLGALCFARRWYDLDNLQAHGLDYFRANPPDSTLVTATILSALLLAAIFWAAWFWVERHSTPGRRKFGQCVFLLLLMFPIESVRRYWNSVTDKFDVGSNVAMWLVEAILAFGLVALLFGSRRILNSARRAALLLTLLFPPVMLSLVMDSLGAETTGAYAPRPSLPMLPARAAPAPRIVWLIFDELDQRVAFERRPAGLDLPELDRLRAESVVANRATQTSLFTTIAVPSLLCSRVFVDAQALGADDLDLILPGSRQRVHWRGEPNVFARARSLGINAALVGWHHPYCRVLGDELVECLAIPSTHSTAALAQEAHAAQIGLASTMRSLFERQVVHLADILHSRHEPISQFLRDKEIQQDQQQEYIQIRDQAYREATDPRIGLLFVHFPTPHLFPIYNRREGSFNLRGPLDYLDNLALVDRTVGELRRTLERAGLWNQTSVLITTDHGLRPTNWAGHLGWTAQLDRLTEDQAPRYVPLILKLAGQEQAAVVDKTFSNVLSADLILAVLAGDVTTSAEAAAWLNQHAGQAGAAVAESKR